MNSFVAFFSKNKLIKDIFTYGYGTFIAKSVNFFTIPIYTRIFLPEVYGQLEYFLIYGALFGTLLNIGLDSALSFFYKVEETLITEENYCIVNFCNYYYLGVYYLSFHL